MFAWMRKKWLALVVATVMFAVMAAVMAEFLLMEESPFKAFWGEGSETFDGMLWTWRIGGFLTWPVFMWLLLREHVDLGNGQHRSHLAKVLVAAALYGGGGLWAISEAWQALARLGENALIAVAPLIALLSLGLPYLYTWGFVALYGFARDAFAGRSEHGWIPRSMGAAVIGIYGIGALVYFALALVMVPVGMVAGILPEEAALHAALDLCAIALSTGNFVSQWYAFYKVDEWFDEQAGFVRGYATRPSAPADPSPGARPTADDAWSAQPQPRQAQQPHPQQPSQPQAGQPQQHPDGTVILPDGRLVTPDGQVYVPQNPGALRPPEGGGTGDGPMPYSYGSKG